MTKSSSISEEALKQILTEARTHNVWLPKPVIIAARSLGLDCGPMSGFDNAKVDAAFFQGTSWKSNFICNLGYGCRCRRLVDG